MALLDQLFGRPLASNEEGEQRIGPLAGIPMLGLDALSSSAYGPEAALTLLLPLGVLGLGYLVPIMGVIVALLVIVTLSYRQTIAAYPTGGGSYTVAKENLGVGAGLLAAAALMLDYVLNVAVGISAGTGALVSALPQLQPYTLAICLLLLLFIALVNLRGVRESGLVFVAPTYLFVGCLGIVLLIGLVKTVLSGGVPVPVVAPAVMPASTETLSFWLLLRAFASGCTAMTGIEAVSNGVPAFRAPAVQNARRTLFFIVSILITLLVGIALLARTYNIGATEPGAVGYESVLSQLLGAVVGKGVFYYVTIGSILAVLALSANTSFADFPRLCQIIARDDFLPHAFASRGRRLVFSLGIYVLTALSALLLIAFGGVTDRLIPLFAVGAFGAFTLSQAGMVVHWVRQGGRGIWRNSLLNGVGALATGSTLLVVLTAKFLDGAWITLLLIPIVLLLFVAVRRHYRAVAREISCTVPLDLAQLRNPIVIVPMKGWNYLARKALRFAFKLSHEVYAVQVRESDQIDDLHALWPQMVEQPAKDAGLPVPQLVVIESPYRRLVGPLLTYIMQVKDTNPDRQIAVIIPDLVEHRWYHYLLHNQQGDVIKTLLLLRGDQRIVVINVPWYLKA